MSLLQAPKRFAVAGVAILALASAPAVQASASEITDLVNHLRSASSKCAGAPGLDKLVRRPELDGAASRMAGGASLADSAKGTSYQSLRLHGISMSGSTNVAALERLLVDGHCPMIVDPRLVEVGVHQQGTSTWVVLAPAFAPAGGQDNDVVSALMVTLVNDARASGRNCGGTFFPAARPVVLNEILSRVARSHSDDMARHNFFSHHSRDGTTSAVRVERAGYDYRSTAENIAGGQMTAEAAMAAWLTSPGHCANLMDAAFSEMGVAHSSNRQSQLGVYWTQVFGAQRAMRAVKVSRPSQSGGLTPP